MTVSYTISKTLGGAQVTDVLTGDPGNQGLDLGNTINGEYTPIISKAANTGWQALYFSHDAAVDQTTDNGTFIGQFSQVYGGADSAANDLTTLTSKGASSSNSPNNGDGNGGGLRVEHDADLGGTLGASAFDGTRAQVSIYGASGAGVSLATAFDIHVDAMVYNNAGTPVDATTPVTGQVGKSGDTVLGDVAFLKYRYYLEDGATNGGILQFDLILKYSFTA